MSSLTLYTQQCFRDNMQKLCFKLFVNIFVQHRLKYGEFDVGNATCQNEMDSDKKLGRNTVR